MLNFFCSHFWLPFGFFHVPVFLTFSIDFFQTPGRLHTSQGVGDMVYNEEYIVYNISQVMPLCLISYAGTWGCPNNPRPLHPHQSTPGPLSLPQNRPVETSSCVSICPCPEYRFHSRHFITSHCIVLCDVTYLYIVYTWYIYI